MNDSPAIEHAPQVIEAPTISLASEPLFIGMSHTLRVDLRYPLEIKLDYTGTCTATGSEGLELFQSRIPLPEGQEDYAAVTQVTIDMTNQMETYLMLSGSGVLTISEPI